MGQPIVNIEIQARDFPMMKRFYSELFGWEIGEPNEWQWTAIHTGSERGAQGGMSSVPEGAQDAGRVFFYVEVDDLKATLAKAEAMGGKTVVPPWEEIGLAVMVDPEGNRVGLLRRRG